jgi:hypothetical protein
MKEIITGSKKDDLKLEKRLKIAVQKVKKMPLGKLLPRNLINYGPRFDNYFNSRWVLKKIPLAECGTWPRMGGLPAAATYGTVIDTANYIRPYLDGKKKMIPKIKRALYIKRLGNFAEIITEHVPIIVFEDGIIRHGKLIPEPLRKPYKKCKYDIDDGNHRAVSLALDGKKKVWALVGKRTHKSNLLYF